MKRGQKQWERGEGIVWREGRANNGLKELSVGLQHLSKRETTIIFYITWFPTATVAKESGNCNVVLFALVVCGLATAVHYFSRGNCRLSD